MKKYRTAKGLTPEVAQGDRITANRQPGEMPIREKMKPTKADDG